MSTIGAIIMGILLITGIMLAGGNYKSLGISQNVWIGVNVSLFISLVAYEIHYRFTGKNRQTDDTENIE